MKKSFTSFLFLFLFIASMLPAQSTLYVSPGGGNNPPYATLGDAATDIQTAVNAAIAGDLILVDDGTYTLTANISITKGVTVKSINGYAAVTVDGNNVTRCFFIDHADAVVDGFTIINGYNPSSFGGGVDIDNGGTLQNCYVSDCQARDGGGVAIDYGGLVQNCIITNNDANNNSDGGYGGGIRLLNAGTARNCLVYGNSSENLGGGINIWNAGTIENCTVTNNTGPNGAGIRCRGTSVMRNTISYFNNGTNVVTSETANKTYENNCTTPALPLGTNNTIDDPLFEDAGSLDYHLSSSSTLIDAGLNQGWMNTGFDLDGNARIANTTVDIGAYEYSGVSLISDDFFPETTPQGFWSFYNPLGDAVLTMSGTNAEIFIPAGTAHDLYTTNYSAPRLLQDAPDTDFTIEVKFESTPTTQYQLQGIIVQTDDDTFIRFGTYYGSSPYLFLAAIDNGSLMQPAQNVSLSVIPHYLKVERSGDDWTYSYSDDGATWTVGASINQTFTVVKAGFYAGTSGSNPAFTANADYFMSHDDPITDTDSQPPVPPVIDVWYGDTQDFGVLGNPQTWVNILGRVTDNVAVASLSYKLNGGASVPLVVGPNGTRLIGTGDFNIELDRSVLVNGPNTVELTAIDDGGASTVKNVTVNYTAGNVWPMPYTLDWNSISTIDQVDDVAEVVDGLWELATGGIKTTETGYDRLIVVGDQTWNSNYEVEVPITIHSHSADAGIGFGVGWQGHTGTVSPRTQWPLQAIGWVRYSSNNPQLRILTYTSGVLASQNITVTNDVTYILKTRSESIGGGQSRFYVKIWEEGTIEPTGWMIQSDLASRDGSVLMITHKADVTWGNMVINPVIGNQTPQFTSSPGTSAEVGQLYTYNITTSDPDVGDVLSITAPTLPGWLTLTDNGNGTATLSGIPAVGDLGSNSVELKVEDLALASSTQPFSIFVYNAGEIPPISDNFCPETTLNTSLWEFYDPIGDATLVMTGENAEISFTSAASHDLASNSSPRLLQTIPDDDFGVEVKFDSVPNTQYQMQGIIVQTSAGGRLRFETYFGSAPYFYVNGYGVSIATINNPIGGPIPAYLRVIRTGDFWEFNYSYDGTIWNNVTSFTLNVPVEKVGFYGANHTPNPPFTVSAAYFKNINDTGFSDECLAGVGDKVWNDVNQNGIQDPGELGIENVTVDLYNCIDLTVLQTTTTNVDGEYLFNDLTPDDYRVGFTLPTNFYFSPKESGSDAALDSNPNTGTGITDCFTLVAGEFNETIDCGMYEVLNADLAITIIVDDITPEDGDNITYTITVSNNGPGNATGVEVYDLLPAGLIFVSDNPSQGSYNNLTGIWLVGSIASGANATLDITVEVDVDLVYTSAFDLGTAKDFNVFVLQDIYQPSSDTQGKMAAGRDIYLSYYSVGDQLPSSGGTEDVLIAGRDLTYISGGIFGGNVVYGNSTNLPIPAVSILDGTLRQDTPINFAAEQTYLQNLANTLALYAVNGTVGSQWGGLTLTGNDPYLNVFSVSGADLSTANNVTISVPNGSTVLVNIDGTDVSWMGGLSVSGTSINNVLYNFFEATTLSIMGIDIRGSILAPFADVNFATGVQNGQMIAYSLSGQGQFNNSKFVGNIPVETTIINTAQIIGSDQTDPVPGNNLASVTIEVDPTTEPEDDYNWVYLNNFAMGQIIWTMVADNSGNIYAGTLGGNIYRSFDNGETWSHINTDMFVGAIWTIAFDGFGGIYAGTESGIYKSSDNGATWILAGLTGKDIRTIVVDGSNYLYAGTWGYGVYKSMDMGFNWALANNGLTSYAAVNSMIINSGSDIFVATFGDGVWKSSNGGNSWSKLNVGYNFIWTLGINSTDALFAGSYGNGLYRSLDDGQTWNKVTGLTANYIYSISIDGDDNIYVSSWVSGVSASSDGGDTWTSFGMTGLGVSSIAMGPSSSVLFAGTSDGKLYMKSDRAVTGIEDGAEGLPTEFKLFQNYPNPFNPACIIKFDIADRGAYQLRIFDILGREVALLLNKEFEPGRYNINFNASGLVSGVYIYQLIGPNHKSAKKMLLLR